MPIHLRSAVLICAMALLGVSSTVQAGLMEKLEQQKPSNDMYCVLCQEVVSQIQPLITPDVLDSLRQEAMVACNSLDEEAKNACEKEIDETIKLIQQLVNENPKMVCQQIGICPRNSSEFRAGGQRLLSTRQEKEFALLTTHLSNKLASNINDFVGCETCKIILKESQSILRNNRTIDTVENAVDKFCDFIGKNNESAANSCREISYAYIKEAVKFILEQNPDILCAIVFTCPDVDVIQDPSVCNFCIKQVDSLKVILMDPEAIKKFRMMAESVCYQLFHQSDGQKVCLETANSYINNYIQLVANTSSQAICHHLHAC